MNADSKDLTKDISRIVTRPDFDGVVCAILLKEALLIDEPVLWVQPGQIQQDLVRIGPHDVLANLPYHPECGMWFDHHYSNRIDIPFAGAFELAPSAARVVYRYFGARFENKFGGLVQQADKIDAAQLSRDEILHPEKYPFILLSMTISGNDHSQRPYWDRLVELLGRLPVEKVIQDSEVKHYSRLTIEANKAYAEALKRHTTIQGPLSLTDFRGVSPVPDGNRFLVYCLFPEAVANLKVYRQEGQTIVKIGHSIVNRNCRVNVGRLMGAYGGGGHKGAGACRFSSELEDVYLPRIIQVMVENRPQ